MRFSFIKIIFSLKNYLPEILRGVADQAIARTDRKVFSALEAIEVIVIAGLVSTSFL